MTEFTSSVSDDNIVSLGWSEPNLVNSGQSLPVRNCCHCLKVCSESSNLIPETAQKETSYEDSSRSVVGNMSSLRENISRQSHLEKS